MITARESMQHDGNEVGADLRCGEADLNGTADREKRRLVSTEGEDTCSHRLQQRHNRHVDETAIAVEDGCELDNAHSPVSNQHVG